jgi:hypothetical protein
MNLEGADFKEKSLKGTSENPKLRLQECCMKT